MIYEKYVGKEDPYLSKYLFSWYSVPGDDEEKLKETLRDDFDINCAKNTEILKSEDGKTIRTFKDETSAEIIIDETKEKATLKITYGRTHKLNSYIYLIKDASSSYENYLDEKGKKLPTLFIDSNSGEILEVGKEEGAKMADFLKSIERFEIPQLKIEFEPAFIKEKMHLRQQYEYLGGDKV